MGEVGGWRRGTGGVLGARMMSPWPPAGLNFSGLGKGDVNERPGFFSVSWRKQWRLLPGITDVKCLRMTEGQELNIKETVGLQKKKKEEEKCDITKGDHRSSGQATLIP